MKKQAPRSFESVFARVAVTRVALSYGASRTIDIGATKYRPKSGRAALVIDKVRDHRAPQTVHTCQRAYSTT
jgi:hypothetical protein